MKENVVVIGGGASGMLSAYFSALKGKNVIILEQNEKLGKKLYITGKGRCNLTNNCEPQEFLNNVVHNDKFLLSAIYSFSPQDMIELMEKSGLPLKTERGDRVFPLSDKSSDVIKCLTNLCVKNGVKINLNEKVVDVVCVDGAINKVVTNKAEYVADKVIIACGGVTYPLTGSTGDGYKFAKKMGHTIIQPIQALTSLEIEGDFCKELAGLSLKNVSINAFNQEKRLSSEFGEMLFTHSGVSGPIILTTSSKINKYVANGVKIKLLLDLKPALSEQQLDNRIVRDFEELKNKQLKNSLHLLLPKSLISFVIAKAGLKGEINNCEITKEQRRKLVDVIKNFELIVRSLGGFEQSIITSGGVSTKEINPKTMESKLVKGLYFCGEVIDVDATTGGFNLQIAFSTAFLAGNN